MNVYLTWWGWGWWGGGGGGVAGLFSIDDLQFTKWAVSQYELQRQRCQEFFSVPKGVKNSFGASKNATEYQAHNDRIRLGADSKKYRFQLF